MNVMVKDLVMNDASSRFGGLYVPKIYNMVLHLFVFYKQCLTGKSCFLFFHVHSGDFIACIVLLAFMAFPPLL